MELPQCMIRSFACDDTARLFRLEKVRAFPPDIQRTALRKLAQLHAVTELLQLRVPPGNRLEALNGASASVGTPTGRMKLKSWTTINSHTP